MSESPRLAILNTHPIQYYSPLYRQLASREDLEVHVFYGWRGAMDNSYDPGFQQNVSWDIPLLEGYPYTFVENTADDPGTHHFRGIQNPDMIPTISSWAPDALLVFGWSFQSLFFELRHFRGRVPVLFRGDSTLLDESPGPRKWARRLWLRWVYRHVDAALYVGQNNKEYFRAHGLTEDQLYWVPHAIENQRFYDPEGTYAAEARAWRDELGISPEANVALFAGKLERKKAPDVLLDAFRRAELPDAHLIFVGSGPLEEKLRKAGGDHPRTHFLGFQNQSRMPVAYRLGDVFILPSRGPGETWGLAVNEAMACGRAVVVSDRVGCASNLVDESNGAVVPAESPTQLRDTLAALFGDAERLRRMKRASRERISGWSMEVAAERTRRALDDMLTD
jgi:glycosyltransferase involved in cell wall biosynthesis